MQGVTVERIVGFGLTSADADRLAQFYQAAFGARPMAKERRTGPAFERIMGVRGGALCVTLAIGDEQIEILQFDVPGRPYPQALSPYDTVFQHFALVVSDMSLALARLAGLPGWSPISTQGPQHLPQRSGGVTAFKFRDPEGHPLEFLEFPERTRPAHWAGRGGLFPGIDHSAISVRDTERSVAFYRSLGFSVSGYTLNEGPPQARLDAVPSPQVEVTALSLTVATPHLELLCYRSASCARQHLVAGNDVAATRVITAALPDGRNEEHLLFDPDEHRLLLAKRAG